jgi:hypothetical protein
MKFAGRGLRKTPPSVSRIAVLACATAALGGCAAMSQRHYANPFPAPMAAGHIIGDTSREQTTQRRGMASQSRRVAISSRPTREQPRIRRASATPDTSAERDDPRRQRISQDAPPSATPAVPARVTRLPLERPTDDFTTRDVEVRTEREAGAPSPRQAVSAVPDLPTPHPGGDFESRMAALAPERTSENRRSEQPSSATETAPARAQDGDMVTAAPPPPAPTRQPTRPQTPPSDREIAGPPPPPQMSPPETAPEVPRQPSTRARTEPAPAPARDTAPTVTAPETDVATAPPEAPVMPNRATAPKTERPDATPTSRPRIVTVTPPTTPPDEPTPAQTPERSTVPTVETEQPEVRTPTRAEPIERRQPEPPASIPAPAERDVALAKPPTPVTPSTPAPKAPEPAREDARKTEPETESAAATEPKPTPRKEQERPSQQPAPEPNTAARETAPATRSQPAETPTVLRRSEPAEPALVTDVQCPVLPNGSRDPDCQMALTRLLLERANTWVERPPTAADYVSGARLVAFAQLRNRLTCERLKTGLSESQTAIIALRAAIDGESTVGRSTDRLERTRELAVDVRARLEIANEERC